MIARLCVAFLLLLNAALFAWGHWGLGKAEQAIVQPGLRAELIEIERPWQTDSPVLPPVQVPSAKIDLKQGRAELNTAIENASNLVVQGVPLNQQCRQWGPFVNNEADRIAEALKSWAGQVARVQRQVPVGYVVYLPKAVVESGVGLKQLSEKGVREMFFISAAGPLQGTISLGLFRDLDRARLQQQDILARGVSGVEIRERLGPSRVFFELRGSPAQVAALQGIYELNPKSELGSCPVQTKAESS